MRVMAKGTRRLQRLLRAMVNGVLSDRDRLLQYTTAEFYQELSLFLEECADRQKELDKAKQRQKH